MRVAVLCGNVALHVLDDNDGVVDDQTGGQRDAEHRERVDGESEDLDEGKGADQRDGNGDGGNDGGAPVEQEEEDDDDDDNDRFAQRADDFADRVADDGGGVEGDDVFEARRKRLERARRAPPSPALSTSRALALLNCCTPTPMASWPL